MPLEENEIKYNFRTTWKSRLPTFLLSAALLAISIPTAVIASQGTSGGNHDWWSEANDFPVSNGTLVYLSKANPELEIDAYTGWWGMVYALPPGIHQGGGRAILAASAISAGFAGVGLVVAVLFSDKSRHRLFRDFWRVWFAVPVLASLVAFIHSFVERYTASTPDVNGFLAAGPRTRPRFQEGPIFTTQGRHSVESWSCAIRPIIELNRDPTPRPQPSPNGYIIYPGDDNPCNAAMTARWLTVPMLVVAVASLVVFIMFPFWGKQKHATMSNDTEMAHSDTVMHSDRRVSDQSGKMSSESAKGPV